MKKILLTISLLTSIAFSNSELFNFKNAKPITGNIKGSVEISNEMTKYEKPNKDKTLISNYYENEFKVYDFVKVSGKIGLDAYTNSSKSAKENVSLGESFIDVSLDFKKYGIPNIKFNNSKELEIGYKNEINLDTEKLTITPSAYYKHKFVDGLLVEKHEAQIKLSISKQIKDNLKVDVIPRLVINSTDVSKNSNFKYYQLKLTPILETNLEYLPIKNLKLYTKQQFEIPIKFGNASGNVDNAAVSAKYFNLFFDYLAEASLEYKIDEELHKVKNLELTPKLFSNLEIRSENKVMLLDIIPSFNAKYEIIKNLTLESEAGVVLRIHNNKYSNRNNEMYKSGYYSTTPKLKLALEYKY